MTSKNRKRLESLESRIRVRGAKPQAQATNEWLANLSDEALERLIAFFKAGISADTPVPPDVFAILQTMPDR
jgi:hypothetical protein